MKASTRIFVSYSWDSKEHIAHVKDFVNRLRTDGLEVIYDGDIEYGDRITRFMENSVRDSDFVLYICTPGYSKKADKRKGGVGYENTVITGELYKENNERKFIPVLFDGDWDTSLPYWSTGKIGLDYTDMHAAENYKHFVSRLKAKDSKGFKETQNDQSTLPILNDVTAISSFKKEASASATERLALAIVAQSNHHIHGNGNNDEWAVNLKSAADFAIKRLKAMSHAVESKEDIGRIISRSVMQSDDRNIIIDALSKIGRDAAESIVVRKSNKTDTELRISEGIRLDRGWISPSMVTDEKRMEAVLDNPYILATSRNISRIADILPILEQVAQQRRKIVIIAENIVGEVLSTLVANRQSGAFEWLGVKAPGFGDRRKGILEDIATLTGATLISDDFPFEEIALNDLGNATTVVARYDNTVLLCEDCDKIELKKRILKIKAQIEATSSDYDREKLVQRFTQLVGGVACVNIGAIFEAEIIERVSQMKDAIFALKEAECEGIIDNADKVIKQITYELSVENPQVFSNKLISEILPFAILEDRSPIVSKNVQDAIMEVRKVKVALGYGKINEHIADDLLLNRTVPTKIICETIQHATDIAIEILS